MDELSSLSEGVGDRPHGYVNDASGMSQARRATSPSRHQQQRTVSDSASSRTRKVTLEDLAGQLRIQRSQTWRLAMLEYQADVLTHHIALGTRISRAQRWMRRALVVQLQGRDRSGFAECFHAIQSLRDAWTDLGKERIQSFESITSDELTHHQLQQTFIGPEKLTNRLRAEVVDLLRLVRDEPDFLTERIRSLTPGQLERLSLRPDRRDRPDALSTVAQFPRNSLSTDRRRVAFTNTVRNHGNSLERNDPISMLLHNVFSTNNPLDTIEAERRLNTWSAVCAQLFSISDDVFNPLLCRILTEYAELTEWRARPRLEVFLRESLQKGAFLLGMPADLGVGTEVSLHTRMAEQFFDEAIMDLFAILDDAEGGLPRGALELSSAILGKLENEQLQSAFRGYLLYTWFSEDYLGSFIVEPEAHGAMLDQHIRRDARDRILRRLAARAQHEVYRVFDPESPWSKVGDAIRPHVQNMNNHLVETNLPPIRTSAAANEPDQASHGTDNSTLSLVIAPSEIVSLIDALCPRLSQSSGILDPFANASPNVSGSDNPMMQPIATTNVASGTMYLHDNIPIHAKARPTTTAHDFETRSISHHAALASRPRSGSRRFEGLRKDLETLYDISPLTQPLKDSWMNLYVQASGTLTWSTRRIQQPGNGPLEIYSENRRGGRSTSNTTEKAAIRLAEGFHSTYGSTASSVGFDRFSRPSASLEERYSAQIELCRSKSDSASAHFWWTALRHVREHYQICCLAGNDTKILQPLLTESRNVCERERIAIAKLDRQVAEEQTVFTQVKRVLSEQSKLLENFRDKMWYMTGVRDSLPFENARNVATGLNNMNLSDSPRASMESNMGIHTRPSSSSLLQQAESQTTDLLKAPADHGGPRKLADNQIEFTRKWMEKSQLENFCPGEERFHRFCLEVMECANKLVGENMLDGRFLWSSELFARERMQYDAMVSRSPIGTSLTRPPSVMSDDPPPFGHHVRGQDNTFKATPYETSASPGRKGSFHSFERWKSGRDIHAFETASASDSPGRTVSTLTTDSVGAFWSPAVTQAQSATSIYSNHSRPASVHNDVQGNKVNETVLLGRSRFLERVKSNLFSLLLSDLCCPVWSTGCETDAWLSNVLGQPKIRRQVEKRASTERLLSSSLPSPSTGPPRPGRQRLSAKRSMSADSNSSRGRRQSLLSSYRHQDSATHSSVQKTPFKSQSETFSYVAAFDALVRQLSAEADPRVKLRVLVELKDLVVDSLDDTQDVTPAEAPRAHSHARRWSQHTMRQEGSRQVETSVPLMQPAPAGSKASSDDTSTIAPLTSTEIAVIDRLKKVFLELRPRTLFRDLQLVVTFVEPSLREEARNARALFLTGLAAVSFKSDICRTLVGIADKVIAQDSIKRRLAQETASGFGLADAINFWFICAKEGNAIAQRELAFLYLTHASLLPRASAPMSLSRDTFNATSDSSLRHVPETSIDPSAMRLALHWMHLAAKNGDRLAREQLEEQKPMV